VREVFGQILIVIGTSCSTSTSSWVFAANSNGPLKSDSTSENIDQHDADKYGSLALDETSGQGGPDSNPFVTAAPAASVAPTASASSVSSASPAAAPNVPGVNPPSNNTASSVAPGGALFTQSVSVPSSTKACNPAATGGAAASNGGNGLVQVTATGALSPFQTSYKRAADNGCSGAGSSQGFSQNGATLEQKTNMKRMAHGIMAGLTFAVLFPFGGIAIRLFSFSGLLWFHAGIQIIGSILFIAAFALGVGMAKQAEEVRYGIQRSLIAC
jgi:hypothetical protein